MIFFWIKYETGADDKVRKSDMFKLYNYDK